MLRAKLISLDRRGFPLLLLCSTMMICCVDTSAQALTETPPSIVDEGPPLPLQGRAVREYLWVDVYRIGLYFADDVDLKELLLQPNPVAVRLEIMTNKLPDKPPAEWRTVFRDHLSEPLTKVVINGFATLEKRDVLWFVHDDSGDTSIKINHHDIATATGYGLMRALLRMWIGADPVSEPLREELIEDADEH